VRVQEVRPRAPAEAAGLRANDVITTIDDTPIRDVDDLDIVLRRAAAGQRLRVTVLRNGRSESMSVTLGSRPPPVVAEEPAEQSPAEEATQPRPSLAPPTAPSLSPRPSTLPPLVPPTDPAAPDAEATRPRSADVEPLPADRPRTDPAFGDTPPADVDPDVADAVPEPTDGRGRASLGITVVPVTEDVRLAYGLASNVRRGALITAVRPDSPAEAAGLPIGGVIVRFDQRQIDSADDLVAAVNAARPAQDVELTLWQGDRVHRMPVRLATAGVVSIPTLPTEPAPLPTPRPAGPGRVPPGLAEPGVAGPESAVGPGTGAPSYRSLLSQAERTATGPMPRVPSTVYDPSEMAALRQRVGELTEQVRLLEERLRALEGGGNAPARGTPPGAAPPADFTPGATTPLVLPEP
jgi:serine protease Do